MKKALFKKVYDVSKILKIISHPKRLAILCYIDKDKKNVSSIVESTDLSQSQVSQYLKKMKEENLLISKRNWKNILYSISDKKILTLMKSLKKIFCN